MKLSDFAAVIFDMDGLLIDTETLYCQSWQRAAADCGFVITPHFYERLVGRSRADALQIVLEHFGDQVPMPDFHERVLHYETVCFAEAPIPVKPGAWDMIAAVDAHALPKALATSTHRPAARQRLVRTGLDRHFHITVTGDEVQRPKPAPDIYLAACERLGVSPGMCWLLRIPNRASRPPMPPVSRSSWCRTSRHHRWKSRPAPPAFSRR
ncbi:HAD family phosphatase [Chloracidobacterium sp. S]|uniref:HAD family hydrolase n=1 Tax=Chloracidobacterium aggregatum TaxID=2851959 RepID=UPI001B8B60C7|nr:HAD family phosphatase [Chloracidobacterium aggregatum]QUV87217.1 HAD family phosphatase [Chloracidobacterium sp. S]